MNVLVPKELISISETLQNMIAALDSKEQLEVGCDIRDICAAVTSELPVKIARLMNYLGVDAAANANLLSFVKQLAEQINAGDASLFDVDIVQLAAPYTYFGSAANFMRVKKGEKSDISLLRRSNIIPEFGNIIWADIDDSCRLIVLHADLFRIWNLQSRQLLDEVKLDAKYNCVIASGDIIFLFGNGKVLEYDIRKKKMVQDRIEQNAAVYLMNCGNWMQQQVAPSYGSSISYFFIPRCAKYFRIDDVRIAGTVFDFLPSFDLRYICIQLITGELLIYNEAGAQIYQHNEPPNAVRMCQFCKDKFMWIRHDRTCGIVNLIDGSPTGFIMYRSFVLCKNAIYVRDDFGSYIYYIEEGTKKPTTFTAGYKRTCGDYLFDDEGRKLDLRTAEISPIDIDISPDMREIPGHSNIALAHDPKKVMIFDIAACKIVKELYDIGPRFDDLPLFKFSKCGMFAVACNGEFCLLANYTL